MPAPAQQTEARQQVTAALRSGHADAALSLADQALKAAPHDCGLLSLRAVAHTALGQAGPALQSFQTALSICPTYLPALEGAAQIEYTQHDPHALALLDRVLAVQPENATAHAMLASALRGSGQCVPALPHFAASSALFPTRPDLVENYGFCLAQTGDLAGALNQYRSLLSGSAANPSTRYDVALLEWKTHRNTDALATLEPLLQNDPQANSLALAAKVHEELGETPEAVRLLREAILVAPDDIDNYLDFASVAFAHQSFQAGIDVLDAGLQRMPTAAALYVARGVLEVQMSAFDRAVADFQQAHRLEPKLSFALDALGMVKTQQHQDADSLSFFRTQVAAHPQDSLLQYLLAEQLAQDASAPGTENLRAAIAAAKAATRIDPNYQAAHDLLAVLYLRAQQPRLAIQEAELALAQDPNDAGALYQEILARRRSGDTAAIPALTARLEQARKANGQRQAQTDRYRLETAPNP